MNMRAGTLAVLAAVTIAAGAVLVLYPRVNLGSTAVAPMLTTEELGTLKITDATDVTLVSDSALAPAPVTRADAIATAAREIGGVAGEVRVIRAMAPRYFDDAPRDVWVILYPGGTPPFDGPSGFSGAPKQARVTGVIVDAQTGEVLRGFMI